MEKQCLKVSLEWDQGELQWYIQCFVHTVSVRTIEIFFVSADNDICRYDMPIKTDKQISARYYFYRPITEISADNTDIGLIKFILVTHKEQIC